MSTFIESQKWRYATKQFDASRKISENDLNTLKEAVRLSASSYGLQPYTVFIVENPEIRSELKTAAFGQTPITDASHVFIFANKATIGHSEIDEYINNISTTRSISTESLEGFRQLMKSIVDPLDAKTKDNWTAKQTYIALANLLSAAAELKIDATPMEGFNAEEVNKILGLPEKGLNAALIATVGYRHQDDQHQHYTKVRKSTAELFVTL